MFCPMKFDARTLEVDTYKPALPLECNEARCAWWDHLSGWCSVKSIAVHMEIKERREQDREIDEAEMRKARGE